MTLANLRSLLFPPRKRIYNRSLIRNVEARLPSWSHRFVVRSVILLDAVIMTAQVRVRRLRSLGPRGLFSRPIRPTSDYQVLYLDIGTHGEAGELRWMADTALPTLCDRFTAQGFEAAAEMFARAANATSHMANVQIERLALTHHLPPDGLIRLYFSGADGIGTSLYRDDGGAFEHVPAARLSDWLQEHGWNLQKTICILRMNVEGAEKDIFEDLKESGLLAQIDGFYGLWDDVAKIDAASGRRFESELKRERVKPLSFHDHRDLRYKFRRAALKYDFATSLESGMRRVRGNHSRRT